MDSRVRTLYKIDAQPEAPAEARRIIAEELSSRLPDTTLEDVKLMVSELVTGGVVNNDDAEREPVMLDLCVNGDVRCRVLDQGPGFAARVEQTDAQRWRIRVVEQLSDRWGMQCSPQRTEVWFERQCA